LALALLEGKYSDGDTVTVDEPAAGESEGGLLLR
jgi:hypothetical protein